jgi:hypothetical protein
MDRQFPEIIDFFRGKIPDYQLDSDVDIYNKSSPTIALENLCSQIDDYNIPLDKGIFECLKRLCESKGVDSSYIEIVQSHVI